MLQANQTDVYVSGPLLAAYKQCVVGDPSLLNPPPWLNYSFGPVVSIDSGGDSVSLNSIPSGIYIVFIEHSVTLQLHTKLDCSM